MPTILCGNCSRTHTSVDQVRACYAGTNVPAAPEVERGYFPERKGASYDNGTDRDERGLYKPQKVTRSAAPASSANGGGGRNRASGQAGHVHEPISEDELPPGIYAKNGKTYQVKISGKTQLPYASVMEDGKFVYAPGEIRGLLPKHRVSDLPGKSYGQEETPDDGIYTTDGEKPDILKVYKAVHGSGNMCAKRLHIRVHPTRDAEGAVIIPAEVEWEYLGLAVRFLHGHRKMTLEEGVAFGQIYGVCVRCGATLTLEESIERAMGRVCYSKMRGNAA
jgi:hypothetical protein